MRVLFALVSGITISVALFFGMHLLINNDKKALKDKKDIPHLVYLSEEKQTKVERKKRIKPKEPPKKEPPKKIKMLKVNMTPKVNQNVKIKPFKLAVQKNLDISAISSLSGAQVSAPIQAKVFNAYSLQALKRVSPKYPRRAKLRKKEGYVNLGFSISKNGDVFNVKVLDSNPKGVFEKASIKAIKRWRFKPSNEAKNATIKFNFKLAR